jgi:hypothetical protein
MRRVTDSLQTRNITRKPATAPAPIPSSPNEKANETEDDSTEDDDDLDAPLKSQSQSQGQARTPQKPSHKTPTPEQHSPPKAPTTSMQKPKASSFRIGGKSKNPAESPPAPKPADVDLESEIRPTRESVPPQSSEVTTPKKIRKPFRIGGKKRADSEASQRALTASPSTNRFRATQSPTAEPPSSPPPTQAMKEMTPVQEMHEETPEEKAERKRAELKRKNEEAAKKQAQAKKKKRF